MGFDYLYPAEFITSSKLGSDAFALPYLGLVVNNFILRLLTARIVED